MQSWDLLILRWCNGMAGQSHAFDVLVRFFTNYSPVLFAVMFAWYFFRPSRSQAETRRTVLLSGLSGVVAIAVTALLGLFIYRARPFAALPADQVHLLIPHAPDSSFPSDHTMGSAAFAAGMWGAPDRSARFLFCAAALLVGLSRLVAGVHWPSDVLGSFILGSLVAWAVFRLERPLRPSLSWIVGVVERIERRRGRRPARTAGAGRRD